ncbi:MAG: Na+/melibiose symporter-like transporter [Crocinitomicaceae bacterium]|jgi:Na+/melibiose symporter-like transporter
MNSKDIVQSVVDGKPTAGWSIFRFNTLRWVFMTWSIFFLAIVTAGAAIIFFWEFIQGGELSDVPTFEQVSGGVMLLISFISTLLFLMSMRSAFYIKSNLLVVTEDMVVLSWNGRVSEYSLADIMNPILHFTTGRNSRYYNRYIEFKSKSTNRNERIGHFVYYKDIQLIYTTIIHKIN